jgi:hypothetical protein
METSKQYNKRRDGAYIMQRKDVSRSDKTPLVENFAHGLDVYIQIGAFWCWRRLDITRFGKHGQTDQYAVIHLDGNIHNNHLENLQMTLIPKKTTVKKTMN